MLKGVDFLGGLILNNSTPHIRKIVDTQTGLKSGVLSGVFQKVSRRLMRSAC